MLTPGGKNDGLTIDHAYLRAMTPFDNGTIHLFLANRGKEKVMIRSIFVDGVCLPVSDPIENLMEDLIEDLYKERSLLTKVANLDNIPSPSETIKRKFIWWQVLPNPILPGCVADIVVKLAAPASETVKVGVETSQGQRYHCSLPPTPHLFRIAFVGFSDELDELYVYLENEDCTKHKVRKLYLDTKDVTKYCSIPWDSISPGEKRCIVVRLSRQLRPGQYIAVKVETEAESSKEEVLTRVFSFFPIASEDGYVQPDLYLDAQKFSIPYSRDFPNLPAIQEGNPQMAYHVLSCPMHAHGSAYDSACWEIILAVDRCRMLDPFSPTYIHICRLQIEHALPLFGETADIIRFNPDVVAPAYNKLEEKTEHRIQWLTRLGKEACAPRPIHTLAVACSDPYVYYPPRNPAPEEIRLRVYYTISRGAKGIFYRGLETSSGLHHVIRGVNKELQILKNLLKVSEPVSWAECSQPMVEANSLLVGQEAIILILINNDYAIINDNGTTIFTCSAKHDFVVVVNVPDWFKISSAYDITDTVRGINYHRETGKIIIPIDELKLTRQIVLSSDLAPMSRTNTSLTLPWNE
jgi:hypothetical protein